MVFRWSLSCFEFRHAWLCVGRQSMVFVERRTVNSSLKHLFWVGSNGCKWHVGRPEHIGKEEKDEYDDCQEETHYAVWSALVSVCLMVSIRRWWMSLVALFCPPLLNFVGDSLVVYSVDARFNSRKRKMMYCWCSVVVSSSSVVVLHLVTCCPNIFRGSGSHEDSVMWSFNSYCHYKYIHWCQMVG